MLKKILILNLVWIVLFSLAACNKPAEQRGGFYTLQEASDTGLLTTEDLQNIEYYHNDDSMPMYPDALSSEIEKAIKETRASDLRAQTNASGIPSQPEATADDVEIIRYYGKYNDCYAVMINDNFTLYGLATWSETVNGVTFYYGDGNRIFIWNEEEMDVVIKNIIKQVKQTYVDMYLKSDPPQVDKYVPNGYPQATIDDVYIGEYLGIYNGSFVAVIMNTYKILFIEVVVDLIIEDMDFSYSYGYPIRVWKSGSFYELKTAYDSGILTKDNLQSIYYLYYNKSEQEKL